MAAGVGQTDEIRCLILDSAVFTSYAYVRSLRDAADFIAVVGGRESYASVGRSNFVDRRLLVRPLAWQVEDNRPAEELFVQTILSGALENRANWILPSSDYETLCLSQSEAAFRAAGIEVLAAGDAAVRQALDKSFVVQLARDCGVPVPASELFTDMARAQRFAQAVGYPLIAKAVRSSGSEAVVFVGTAGDLPKLASLASSQSSGILLQAYIPGGREPSVNFILDRFCVPRFAWTLRKRRYVHTSTSVCIETVPPLPEHDRVALLVRKLRLSGPVGVQMKQDPRTGEHFLIEVNPRFGGNVRMFFRLAARRGVNVPLLAMQAKLGRDVDEVLTAVSGFSRGAADSASGTAWHFPPGDVGAAPLEEIMAFMNWSYARRSSGKAAGNAPVPSLGDYLGSLYDTYLRQRARPDYFAAGLLDDRAAVVAAFRRMWTARRRGYRGVPWGDLRG